MGNIVIEEFKLLAERNVIGGRHGKRMTTTKRVNAGMTHRNRNKRSDRIHFEDD